VRRHGVDGWRCQAPRRRLGGQAGPSLLRRRLSGCREGQTSVARREPGGFDADEITLPQTFADLAVIAIENVRLFNETKEALEQQTATGDILKVIASSPTEIQPVLESLATRWPSARMMRGAAGPRGGPGARVGDRMGVTTDANAWRSCPW
jgi:hypothetical protein